ncbi:MAG: OmpA family protein [Bacteroidales bacterium]|jgi:tetratricopeptide (TPR) repeat protein
MRQFYLILLLLISGTISGTGYSQGLHTNSGKAVKKYNEGKEDYDNYSYQEAELYLKEAIGYDSSFFEAYMMLGELYYSQDRFTEAASYYHNAVKIDSMAYRPVFFKMANAEFMSGDYSNALVHYSTYLRDKGNSDKNRAYASRNIINCEFAIEAMKKPVSFNLINAGPGINTTDDEYWPSITADGKTMIFTRQMHAENFPGGPEMTQENFYISNLSGDEWQKAVNAGEPLNTDANQGAATISSDGKYMYFAACNRSGGMGSCDIYFSTFNDGKWSVPYNLNGPVNTKFWESTPSISADGKTLYFSSNRPGGFGGKDLWYSRLKADGTWSEPVNMGKTINTEGDEIAPFIHFDGKTLYFSSNGRPGMGGYDIYISRLNDDSTWSEPKNLGYPINTFNDEMGLIIDATGQRAYISTKRNNEYGKDIFYFDLDESIRPNPVSYLKGQVIDKETGKLLKADYELINLSTNRVTIKSSTDDYGNFLVCLPSGCNYGINVSLTGYLFYSENFMFEGKHSVMEPLVKKIPLSPAKVGEKMLLANVFYEFDSWELKKESMQELNNLADMLEANRNIILEIGGYTDSTGTREYNLALSEKRALSVVNYLIGKGIPAARLKYKGYGNTSPVGDNVTYEGRKLNRRTEAKVISSLK